VGRVRCCIDNNLWWIIVSFTKSLLLSDLHKVLFTWGDIVRLTLPCYSRVYNMVTWIIWLNSFTYCLNLKSTSFNICYNWPNSRRGIIIVKTTIYRNRISGYNITSSIICNFATIVAFWEASLRAIPPPSNLHLPKRLSYLL
jgi:hypothetical protein